MTRATAGLHPSTSPRGGRRAAALTLGLWLGLAPITGAAADDCVLPFSPGVPDGRVADENAMRIGREQMQSFVARAETFLSCIEAEEKKVDAEFAAHQPPTPEQSAVYKVSKDELGRRYNAGVDAQKAAADKFNDQLRIYRARIGATPTKPG